MAQSNTTGTPGNQSGGTRIPNMITATPRSSSITPRLHVSFALDGVSDLSWEPTTGQTTTTTAKHNSADRLSLQTESSAVTKKKRQQLRDLVLSLEPLRLDEAALGMHFRSNGVSLSEDERDAYHADLDVAVRWNTFLVHTNKNLLEVVAFVSRKHQHNLNEVDFQLAWAKAVESHHSYTTSTCGNLQQLAASLMKADPVPRHLDDDAFLAKIDDHFSAENFLATFDFMQEYLNYEGCTPTGKWYMMTVRVNLVAQMVYSLCDRSTPDRWNQVLDNFENTALLEAHDHVDTTHFSQFTPEYRNKKEKKKRSFAATQSAYRPRALVPKQELAAHVKATAYSAKLMEQLSGFGRIRLEGPAHEGEDDVIPLANAKSVRTDTHTLTSRQ